jgi:hypothetical protein
MSQDSRRKAIVTGMIATYPVGGVLWDYGQYLLGLERLGFEVCYLEDTGGPTYDPRRSSYGDDPSYAVEFLARSLAELSPSLGARWHFRAADGRTFGMGRGALETALAGADLFLNVSGSCLLRPEYAAARRKVLIDTDPGWNHFVNYPRWDAGHGWPGVRSWREHDFFFTYAERIGKPGCALPALGIGWLPTRPPVVLDAWRPRPPGTTWTTVMTWDNFRRPIEHEGVAYGTKEKEFETIEALPRRLDAACEVAVGGSNPPLEHWRSLGWSVRSSEEISRTADRYRDYVASSRGELSVAKNVYVATRSGWFSCRSTCYLASGRPVVLQDTGFSEVIPTGAGILAFATSEQAAAALRAVELDYARHAAAAREIAREQFASELVLGHLLRHTGL